MSASDFFYACGGILCLVVIALLVYGAAGISKANREADARYQEASKDFHAHFTETRDRIRKSWRD